MNRIFHRDNILNDPIKAWEKYRQEFCCSNFPERITIELTNRCNLQCFMCPRNVVRMKPGDMNVELFKKIIDEASQFLPVCLVPFFRGESLLHPQFIEMVRYAKEKGMKPIQFATNAHFLTDKISQELIDIGLDFISFSVDAMDKNLYKEIRGTNNFNKVFSNILSFIKKKEKKQSKLPEVQVSCVKTRENEEFIVEFIAFWKDKVDKVRIYYAHSLDGQLGHLEGESEKEKQIERKPCLKLLTDIVIYWDGNVAICNHDWQRKEFIGSIKDDTIKNIWQNAKYQRIRKRHLDGRYSQDTVCKGCSHWQSSYIKQQIIGEVYFKK